MENACPWSQEIHDLKKLLELQIRLTNELLAVCRHTELSAAFAVDAINGLYGLMDQ